MSIDSFAGDPHVPPSLPGPDVLAISEILATLEPDERLLDRAGLLLAKVLAVDCVVFAVYDHGRSRVTSFSFVGLTPEEERSFAGLTGISPLDVPVERAAIASRRPIQRRSREDFQRYPGIVADEPPGRDSDLVVPLRLGERVLGVVYLWRRGSAPALSAKEIDVAAAVAQHVALALQAARDVGRLQVLYEIGRRLAASADLDSLADTIHEAVVTILPVTSFSMSLLDPRDDTSFAPAWMAAGGALQRVEREQAGGLRLAVARDGITRHGDSASVEPGEVTASGGRTGSSVHTPIRSGGEVFGVLSVGAFGEDVFSPEGEEFLGAVASQAAVALVNIRTLASATSRLTSLSTLNRVSETINSTLDVEAICAALDAELATEFGVDAFLVGLTPPEGESEDERAIRAVYQRDAAGVFDHGIGEALRSTIWYALHAAEAISNTDPARRNALQGTPFAPDDTSRSVAILPMRTGDIAVGALCLASDRPNAWGPEDLRVLATIARSAALAIENARLYAEVARERVRIGQLTVWQHALLEGSRIITQGSDLHSMIDAVARQLEALLAHDGFAIYAYDQDRQRLGTVLVRGGGQRVSAFWELEPGQGLTWAAVTAGEPLLANDAHLDPRAVYPEGDPVDPAGGEHEMVAPLIVEQRLVGAVCLAREGGPPFTTAEFEVFSAFAPHLAIALQTAQLVERNRSIHISTIRALTAIIDTKDPLTAGHSERVGEIARRLAVEMRLSAAEQRTIELGGLLHDIGKVGIPDDILAKPGPLTSDQLAVMQAHPVLGADILRATGAPELETLIPLVRHHHERYDGGGYPDGISGGEIPLGAAIIAVAEAYDMLTTDRPWRAAGPPLDALAEIRRNAGSQFDPVVVAALDAIVRRDLDADLPQPETAEVTESVNSGSSPVELRPITVLHRIASEIANVHDLDAFLGTATRIISEELAYANVDLLLPHEAGTHLVARGRVSAPGRPPRDWSALDGQGVAGQALRTGRPAVVNGGGLGPGGPVSAIAVPLLVEGTTVGVVAVEEDEPDSFTEQDTRNLTVIAAQLAPVVELARVHDEVKRAAQRDGLTGIYNYASFYARLEEALAGDLPVTVMIFDVDELKHINDTAGHLSGDHVLRRVAVALEMETRADDFVARYGGDEFAIIATGITEEQAISVARRLQRAVNRLTWGPAREPISISVGVAVAHPLGTTAAELVARADSRMYRSRARDRSPRPASSRERRGSSRNPAVADD